MFKSSEFIAFICYFESIVILTCVSISKLRAKRDRKLHVYTCVLSGQAVHSPFKQLEYHVKLLNPLSILRSNIRFTAPGTLYIPSIAVQQNAAVIVLIGERGR